MVGNGRSWYLQNRRPLQGGGARHSGEHGGHLLDNRGGGDGAAQQRRSGGLRDLGTPHRSLTASIHLKQMSPL